MPDVISVRPYVIGESFTSPNIVRRVAEARRPFFEMSWAAKGPTQTKAELYRSGQLKRFPTVWRRAAKTRHIERLGAVMSRKEMPDFHELGEAPGPTDVTTTTSTVSRGAFGFLNNIITSVGQVMGQQQQLSMLKAQAAAQQAAVTPTILPTAYVPPPTGGRLGMLGWTAIIGAVGVGAYFFMKK